jgi:hypothetical protein
MVLRCGIFIFVSLAERYAVADEGIMLVRGIALLCYAITESLLKGIT